MKRVFLAGALLAVTASLSFAGPVEDRQAVMKAMGKALGPLAAIAKGENAFDAGVVEQNLTALNEAAQKLDVAVLFPEGSTAGETAALPAIWENMADFQERADKLKADVADVASSMPA
ncbi:MAG: cytochrome c, partial [Nitratireductor sp.]